MSKHTEKRAGELLDLDGIMRSTAGRALLRRILEHAGTFAPTFHQDEREHVLREGRRSEGLWLMREMQEANPGVLSSIITEILTDDGHH